jgi:glycerophosphoryl diester phosphodiesterase
MLLACGCSLRAPGEGVPVSNESLNASAFAIIAHRGGGGSAPENTLPAFERSLASGFPKVELDLRLSRDEQLMLFHDDDLKPKTGRSGAVGDYTAAELRSFDIGRWFDREHPEITKSYAGTGLISLRELFEKFGKRLEYHLEIKGDDARVPPLLIGRIDEFGLRPFVIVAAFSRAQVEQVHALAPDLPVCWLISRRRDLAGDKPALLAHHLRVINDAARAGFTQLALPASEFSAQAVAHAHAKGLWIRAYGVKTREDEAQVIHAGADGATTDWPLRFRERLSRDRPL